MRPHIPMSGFWRLTPLTHHPYQVAKQESKPCRGAIRFMCAIGPGKNKLHVRSATLNPEHCGLWSTNSLKQDSTQPFTTCVFCYIRVMALFSFFLCVVLFEFLKFLLVFVFVLFCLGYADSNGEYRKLNFQVFGRISVVMSTFSVFGLSSGRSDDESWHICWLWACFDPLPRNEKLCGNL